MSQQAPDVWRITIPLPFRPREVHAYLVQLEGGEWLLVDGGVDSASAWAVLDNEVRRLAGDWKRVRLNLLTHMHMDHVGFAARVRAASGCDAAMGRLDAERQAHAATNPQEEAEYRAELFRKSGVAPEEVEMLTGGVGSVRDPLAVEHPLDGDTGPLPGAPEWQWVWTPGHTAGHVSLFRPADGVLIAGDAVLPRITPTIGVNRQRADPVGDYLQTLDRLERLAPKQVLPGHGEPIPAPGERLRELRAATRAESAAVLELLKDRPGSAWELATRRYAGRDLPRSVQVQALRETLAHLHHLVAAGRAHAEPGLVPCFHHT